MASLQKTERSTLFEKSCHYFFIHSITNTMPNNIYAIAYLFQVNKEGVNLITPSLYL